MGRRIPSEVDPLIHPAFSLSILVAWIAAITITALCTFKSRKSLPKDPSPLSSPSERNSPVLNKTTTTESLETITTEPLVTETTEAEEHYPKEEPISPKNPLEEKRHHLRSASAIMVSKGKLIKSLSMKIPGNAVAKYKARREEQQQAKEAEESIWKKTIILGERCKVPDEEDAIIYDEKGNRLAAYPARTPRSVPVSRSNSFANPNGHIS